MLTVGTLIEAARTLENLAALAPREYRELADHGRELATQIARACAAVQAAEANRQRSVAGGH